MKPKPNHGRYIQVLRGMTPEQRLAKAFELSDLSLVLFTRGLSTRFPERSPEALRDLVRRRREKCRNRSS